MRAQRLQLPPSQNANQCSEAVKKVRSACEQLRTVHQNWLLLVTCSRSDRFALLCSAHRRDETMRRRWNGNFSVENGLVR